MERQVSLARSRAHSARLQELGSARFHALADRMTLLASDLPLRDRSGDRQPAEALLPAVRATLQELAESVAELPLERAATPYNRDALHRLGGTVTPESTESDDLPWRQVHTRVLRARYAVEAVQPLLGAAAERPLELLRGYGDLLERQAEAAAAAEAAAGAARTPRITPATAYVLGVVHADQRLEVEAARHAFGVSWPDLAHSGWLTDPWLARSN
ncbi:CHAD domain-containing protein [Streptacidiphilus monticola]